MLHSRRFLRMYSSRLLPADAHSRLLPADAPFPHASRRCARWPTRTHCAIRRASTRFLGQQASHAHDDRTHAPRERGGQAARGRGRSPERAVNRRSRRSQSPPPRRDRGRSDRDDRGGRARDHYSPPRRRRSASRSRSPSRGSFRKAAGRTGAVCFVCLSPDTHRDGMDNCRAKELWSGKPAFVRYSADGQLVTIGDGAPVCIDFQFGKCSNSKQGRSHGKHLCSGCGSDGHGSRGCPCRK
jgi:hypothetical protein